MDDWLLGASHLDGWQSVKLVRPETSRLPFSVRRSDDEAKKDQFVASPLSTFIVLRQVADRNLNETVSLRVTRLEHVLCAGPRF